MTNEHDHEQIRTVLTAETEHARSSMPSLDSLIGAASARRRRRRLVFAGGLGCAALVAGIAALGVTQSLTTPIEPASPTTASFPTADAPESLLSIGRASHLRVTDDGCPYVEVTERPGMWQAGTYVLFAITEEDPTLRKTNDHWTIHDSNDNPGATEGEGILHRPLSQDPDDANSVGPGTPCARLIDDGARSAVTDQLTPTPLPS